MSAGEPGAVAPSPPPLLPNAVIGTGTHPLTRATAEQCAEEIRAAVHRAGFPGPSPLLYEGLVRRGLAQVDAATPPPLDREGSLAGALAIRALRSLVEKHAEAEGAVVAAHAVEREREEAFAALMPPWSARRRMAVGGGLLLLAVSVIVGVAYLLYPSMAAFFTGPFYASVTDTDATEPALALAMTLSLACAAVLLLPQCLAVIISWGRLGWYKGLFFAADILFAIAFALMRLGRAFTFQALALSLFEAALTMAYTVALLVIGKRLSVDAERAERCGPPSAALAAAVRERERAEAAAARYRSQLTEQITALEAREYAVRKQEAHRELIAATVAAEYPIAVAELMGTVAVRPGDEHLTATIETYLADAFARRPAVPGDAHA